MTDVMEPLFDAGPVRTPERLARRTDPAPSKQAKPEALGEAAVNVLRVLVTLDDATANELGDAMGQPRNCVSRRLKSLCHFGHARRLPDKRDGGRGVFVTVYQATNSGRRFLKES